MGLRVAGGEDQPHGVVLHDGVHVDRASRSLQAQHVVGGQQHRRLHRGHAGPIDDLVLLVGGGVVDGDPHQEPVTLCLGQRVDALRLDRVLGGEHQEGLRQRVGHPAERHLTLGHHLEERRLHLRRRTVDLVGEDEVGEHRAELDVEALGRGAVDAGADDVRRQQVGGELDAGERAAERARPGSTR